MSAISGCTHLIVLPRLRVQNANAISSPLTHGFPSMTAFLGLSWALERRTRKLGLPLSFKAVGVVCHDHEEQVSDDRFVKALRLTRNPIDKDGGTAAIVEEGRIHLNLSLVFAVQADRWDTAGRAEDLARIADLVASMRVAGGSILPAPQPGSRRVQPWIADLTGAYEDRCKAFREVRVRLLPGSALVLRDDLIDRRLDELRQERPEATRLDAWLSLSRINWRHEPESDAGPDAGERGGHWRHDREGLGWVVPIPVGYGALGAVQAAGSVPNARDTTTPFRFVESLYSIGEWISPHRLRAPEDLLWYTDSQPDPGLYRCRNDYRPPAGAIGLD